MKIALIGNDYTQQFPVLSYGGIETCVENLAWGMHRRGLDFSCVVPERAESEACPFEVIEVPVKPTSISGEKPYSFIAAARKIIIDNKPDVIWSQSNWSADGLFDLDIPIICTFQDSCNKQEGWMKKREALFYRFVSQFQYNNWVQQDWERACSYQLYSGLMDEEYEYCGEKEEYFLWVGGFNWGWEAKGLPVFILLAKENPDTSFIAYGGGNKEVEEAVLKYSKEIPNFEFKGTLKRGKEHREVFGKAKALIMPSRIPDTFPRTVLESLSKGTPVIGSANGALPEMIGDYGLASNDVKDLNKALYIDYDYEATFEYSKRFHVNKEIDGLLAIVS